jgi:hypothetical protein
MIGSWHPNNGTVQTAILDLCSEKGLVSVHEEDPFTWVDCKAHIQNEKQLESFLNYYTHYFSYYTHYFAWLIRIAVAVITSYALQICVQRFCVLDQVEGASRKLPLLSEGP